MIICEREIDLLRDQYISRDYTSFNRVIEELLLCLHLEHGVPPSEKNTLIAYTTKPHYFKVKVGIAYFDSLDEYAALVSVNLRDDIAEAKVMSPASKRLMYARPSFSSQKTLREDGARAREIMETAR